MACSTGEACGFTDTRSSARNSENHSAVMRLTIDALDAWWPPTFTPERFSRTRLAWCTIAVASQSTRRWTASSVSRSGAARGCDGTVVVGVPLKPTDLPIPHREDHVHGHLALHSAHQPLGAPVAGRNHAVAIGLHMIRLHLDRFPDAQPLPSAFAKRVLSLRGDVGLEPVLASYDYQIV